MAHWTGTAIPGTAGGVHFWQGALNRMQHLNHLTLCHQLSPEYEKLFTDSEVTNIRGNVVKWFLPGL